MHGRRTADRQPSMRRFPDVGRCQEEMRILIADLVRDTLTQPYISQSLPCVTRATKVSFHNAPYATSILQAPV